MGADQSSAKGSGNMQGTPTLDDAYLDRKRENTRVTESSVDNSQVFNTDTSSGDNSFVANYACNSNEISESFRIMQDMLQHNNTNPENVFIALLGSEEFKDTVKKTSEQYDAAESDAQKKEILNSYIKNLMHMGMTAGMDAGITNSTLSAPNSSDIDVD